MRLDKDIWTTNCNEYRNSIVAEQDLRHLTTVAQGFLSMWLELLQDDRAPATRILRTLALPDLFAVIRQALDLFQQHAEFAYRLHASLRQAIKRIDDLRLNYPARLEAHRFITFGRDYIDVIEADDRQKSEGLLRQKYGLQKTIDVEKYLLGRIRQLAIAVHARYEQATSTGMPC